MDDLRRYVRLAAVPPEVPDQPARRAAAVMVSVLGVPYFSISGGHGLRLRGRPDPALDPVSFVGYAVRIEPLECLALFMLRPASSHGRCSIVSDLRAAAALVEDPAPEFFDARSEHLHGAGTPDAPFSILDSGVTADGGWLRWSGTKPFGGRAAEHRAMLEIFAELLEVSPLDRGDLLIADVTERLRPPCVSR
ncbi:hypothetical protein [Amycolatopsis keratiniphila]|uniref:hypothetical protein n=1 Tax=Amycolatopsis keratiniphila TaxID=129921 RepID=UPI00087AC945|nr:hypothetical protein [Amycolatopsis keratiniphila]OLZ51909.1 hypothetical protein BS330_25050 [Amycolatopsis keratiniphila subsp. nogabecina]SDU62092.1 hypothetical protein SAMN04489733_7155 [Amycolatopsis keratiniphila]